MFCKPDTASRARSAGKIALFRTSAAPTRLTTRLPPTLIRAQLRQYLMEDIENARR
jgi:hypothetical protein